MYNHGQKNVGYSIDTTKLDRLKESNYGYPIIKCLDPKGAIPSQSYFGARFVFSPIEEKDYSVIYLKSISFITVNERFKWHLRNILEGLDKELNQPHVYLLSGIMFYKLTLMTTKAEEIHTTEGRVMWTRPSVVVMVQKLVSN